MSNQPNPRSPGGSGSPADPNRPKDPGAPESSSPASDAGDGELSLEDYDQRPQQRQKLPDQRREKPSFEMGGPVGGVREEMSPPSFSPELFESTTTAGEGGWEPATADEIANYDLSGSEPVPNPVIEKPATPRAPVEKKPAENLNDIEEFIARTTVDTPSGEKPVRVRRPFSLVEKVCFGAGGALLLSLLIWLGHAAVSAADGGHARSSARPSLPMKGSLITITQAAADWRKSVKDVDRVEQIEVILPTPGHFDAGIIPELTFAIDSSASTTGFLRFIFRDSDERPRGDTRVMQVTNGKLSDPGAGGTVKSGSDATVYCSSGFFDESAYRSYVGGDVPRWSIEVAESSSYNSDDKDWKILGTFDVRNSLAP